MSMQNTLSLAPVDVWLDHWLDAAGLGLPCPHCGQVTRADWGLNTPTGFNDKGAWTFACQSCRWCLEVHQNTVLETSLVQAAICCETVEIGGCALSADFTQQKRPSGTASEG
jgi:phage terminase large subunit GpA-like protein